MYLVAKDMEQTLTRYLGNTVNAEAVIDCRLSINDALQELWGEHEWPWYQGQSVFQINAPYSTGTVTFDLATRRFTLTGGTWPEWVTYSSIRIGTKDARITKRVSDTIVEIESQSPFLADLLSATTYIIYRNEYPLPTSNNSTIRKMSYIFLEENAYASLQYIPPMEFRSKMPGTFGSVPLYFTVQRDRNPLGGLVIVFWPYPTRQYTARFSYIRAANEVTVWDESNGKISVTAASGTVTGASTAFESLHQGCLLRVGRDGTNLPTPRYGPSPFSEETLIDTVSGATALSVAPAIVTARTSVKYMISNLIDIDQQILNSAFLQQCYFELAKRRKMSDKDISTIDKARSLAIDQAKRKASPNQEITYAGSFSNLRRYAGVWFNIGV